MDINHLHLCRKLQQCMKKFTQDFSFVSKLKNTCIEHLVLEYSCSDLVRTFIVSEMENSCVLFVTRFCFFVRVVFWQFLENVQKSSESGQNSQKIIKIITIVFINIFCRLEGNWSSLTGKTIWTEIFYLENFLLHGQTRRAKLFSQLLNLPGTCPNEIPVLVCLYYTQNNAWLLGDIEFLFMCLTLYVTCLVHSLMRYWGWTIYEKFHIYTCPCILYLTSVLLYLQVMLMLEKVHWWVIFFIFLEMSQKSLCINILFTQPLLVTELRKLSIVNKMIYCGLHYCVPRIWCELEAHSFSCIFEWKVRETNKGNNI